MLVRDLKRILLDANDDMVVCTLDGTTAVEADLLIAAEVNGRASLILGSNGQHRDVATKQIGNALYMGGAMR